MKESRKAVDTLQQALALARKLKPAYAEFYPFLEALFLAQIRAGTDLSLEPPALEPELVQVKLQEGFPLLDRWAFPIDMEAAEAWLRRMKPHIPEGNQVLAASHARLAEVLAGQAGNKEAVWRSFLQLDGESWRQWFPTGAVDEASLLFWARSALRPSLEHSAERLLAGIDVEKLWSKGYCPVCGSLPSLLLLRGDGERWGVCSWCSSQWRLARFQCPYCDNRNHDSLGFLSVDGEADYRIHYCRLCKMYFKLVDGRERIGEVYPPLEEWITLHLDLVAQRAGWTPPPSPSPVVYETG